MEKEIVQDDIMDDVLDSVEQTTEETVNEDDKTQDDDEQVAESSEKLEARLAELEEANRKLYARLKRESKKESKKETSVDSLELMEFFSQGGTREEYNQLAAIMRGKDLSMAEAMEDDLYKALKAKMEADKRDEAAQIKSGRVASSDKSFKPGMSRADHKAEWEKKMSSMR